MRRIYVPFDADHTLDDADRETVRSFAPTIFKVNRDVNAEYHDYHRGEEIPQEVERLGAVLAFTRLAGVEPINLCLHEGWAGVGCINCYLPWPTGFRECNVIYTRTDPPEMLKDEGLRHYANGFALMIGSFPTYRFRGWALHREFILAANIKPKFGRKPTYSLRQQQLHPTLDLIEP